MKNLNMKLLAAAVAGAATLALNTAAFAQNPMRVVGNFSGNKIHVEEVERPFFQDLEKSMGIKMIYNPMDAIGVNAADALRMIKSGSFDIMSVQIGMAARDDPFFEGIDLAGVAADLKSQREAAKAFKAKMDERLQKRFNAKMLTLWPFGPQMMFCNGDINSVDDLKGKKVRVFTASMSRLVEGLGATPVTLQFSEVYLALQRGVADCGVTAPSAGNSGKWPEVTKVFVPLSLSYSVQGHMMNLDRWKALSPEQQKSLEAKFNAMEDRMWDIAAQSNEDAIRCSTGQDDCKKHGRYNMKLVDVSGKSRERIVELTNKVVLPPWAESCTRGYKECVPIWNDTVGKATGFNVAAPAK